MASHYPSDVSSPEWASVRTLLLLHGFDPDKPNSSPKGRGGIKWTPLNYACTRGWLIVCSYLVAHGADVRAADWSGTTPMKCACSAGKLHVAKWLYDNGAQDDVRRCDIGGVPPIGWSSLNNHTAVSQWLVLHGAFEGKDGRISRRKLRAYVINCDYPAAKHSYDQMKTLIKWSQECLAMRSHFYTALKAMTISRASLKGLSRLAGVREIRQKIADFAGIVYGRRLRNLRQFEANISCILHTGPCVHSNIFLDNVCGGGRHNTLASEDDSDDNVPTGSDDMLRETAPRPPNLTYNWRADAILGCLQQ